MTQAELLAHREAMTEEERENADDRFRHFMRTDIEIDVKVKNCGNDSYITVYKHAQYILPRKVTTAICKAVLIQLILSVKRSEERIAKRITVDAKIPEAIVRHENNLLRKKRTTLRRLKRAMEILPMADALQEAGAGGPTP